jgi:hypothetical protein
MSIEDKKYFYGEQFLFWFLFWCRPIINHKVQKIILEKTSSFFHNGGSGAGLLL